MWSLAHAQVTEAVIELNRISHIPPLHWAQTAVQTPWKLFVLVCSHISMQKMHKCKENTVWSHWFVWKGRFTVDPPMLHQWSQFTQTCSPPHCTSRVFKLTMCVLHSPSAPCVRVCVCVCNSPWGKLGWPCILWSHNSVHQRLADS